MIREAIKLPEGGEVVPTSLDLPVAKGLYERLSFILQGGEVRRFHTVPTIKENTVAAHGFGAAWLVWLLTEGTCRARLVMAALAHDLAEQTVGDVPSPAKRALGIGAELDELEDGILRANGVAFSLTPEEARTLKVADCLDGMLFCVRELRMGNRSLDIVYRRYLGYLVSMNLEGVEATLLNVVNIIYQEARA